MSKRKATTKKKSIQEIIKFMPAKERKRIEAADLTLDFLNTEIEQAQQAMKLDRSFGLPWLIAYVFCLWKFRYTMPTLMIFGVGFVYFAYAIYSRGSYGLNSRRVKVFEEIKAVHFK